MKRVMIAILMVGLMCLPAMAEVETPETSGRSIDGYDDVHHTHKIVTNEEAANDWALDAKVDMPDIIKISENISIGAEVTKKLVQTNAKEGWGAVAKVTIKWSILDLTKEK